MMSVCLCGPSYMKRTAKPRGWALGSLSGIVGRPVELEKRMTTGVDGWLKCGAFERALASDVGVKVPFNNIPRACARLNVSCSFLSFVPKRRIANEMAIVIERIRTVPYQSRTWTISGMWSKYLMKRINHSLCIFVDLWIS